MADVDEIEEQIRRNRMALSRDIRELEDRAHAAVNWRTQYEQHVAFALGVAFGAGVICGVVAGGDDRREIDEPTDLGANRRSIVQKLDPSGRAANQVTELWNDVMGAVIATAGAAAIARLSELIPGFRDQLDARSSTSR